MAEAHVLYSLKKRRQEISTEIRKLTTALAHIDATILLMEPDYKKTPALHGSLTRQILEYMREHPEPITSKEIAIALREDLKPVRSAMDSQRLQGLVKGTRRSGGPMMWELTGRTEPIDGKLLEV